MEKRVESQASASLPGALMPRLVELRLFYEERNGVHECNFWVGGFKRGHLAAPRLFESKNIADTFLTASQQGLNENEPVLLTDSMIAGNRYFYLFPKEALGDGQVAGNVDKIVAKLQGFELNKIGIYFAPEVFGEKEAARLTQELTRQLCQIPSISSIYLFKGTFDYNRLVNLAHELKSKIDHKSLFLTLYH